jgi:hypothetical protein
VPHLGRQVEGDRQPGRARLDQLVVAPVGLGRGPEAGVLAHRPRPAGVHARVDPAGVRELPRLAQLGRGVPVAESVGSVDGLERPARLGLGAHAGSRRRRERGERSRGVSMRAGYGDPGRVAP